MMFNELQVLIPSTISPGTVHRGLVMLGVSLLLLTGCHRGDTPPLGKVEGVVTINGSPLEQGRIYFVPEKGGRTSEGEIGSDGRYRLIYTLDDFGAVVGNHTVKISTQNEFGGGERIPDKYNSSSELKASVEPGSNQKNFDLAEVLRVGARRQKK